MEQEIENLTAQVAEQAGQRSGARKLGVGLWIMLCDQIDYEEFRRRGQEQSGAVCAGMLETGFGANGHRPVG